MSRILVVVAHPDDEILGCGATMARLSEEGNEIHILILGEGITSRQDIREPEAAESELHKLHLHVREAASIVGAKSSQVLNFPDNRFDSVALLDIIKAVEKKKEEISPEIVLTHHAGDLNIDHQRTFQAVLTACRPIQGETVKEIYAFEVPSSTEWQAQTSENAFLPTQYVAIKEKHLDTKVAAMQVYASECREYPHPRSPEALRLLAKWSGVNVGMLYAEAFEVIRRIVDW